MRSLPTAGRAAYFELLNREQAQRDARSAIAGRGGACSTPCARRPTSSSTASGRRPPGGSASTRRALHARHPHLVCASISGFGQTGPYAERAAHDINYQALAGLLTTAAAARAAGRRHRRGDAGGDSHPRRAAAARAHRHWQHRRRVDSRRGDGVGDVSDDRRARERLLQRLRNRGWAVARARRARAEVLEGVLRADRAAGPRAAAARAGRRADARSRGGAPT